MNQTSPPLGRLLALLVVLAVLPSNVEAQNPWKWDFICGGNEPGLNLCASVHLSFTDAGLGDGSGLVTMDVWNLSELAQPIPSMNTGVFTKIAFFNVHDDVSVLDPGLLSMTGGEVNDPEEWEAGDDGEIKFNNSGGNLGINLGATTESGVNGGIASGCTDPGISNYWFSECFNGQSLGQSVQFTFMVENWESWDLSTTGLTIHAQNLGDDREGSTTCITYGEAANCGTSVVPEPGTVLLLSTGLIALGGMAWRRREEDA